MADAKGSKKKLIMIVIAGLIMGGIGFGGFMLGRKGGTAEAKSKSAVNEEIAVDAGGEAEAEHGAAPAEGGHGEAKADAHGGGGDAQGGEGAATAAADSKKNLLFKFEDFTVNLFDPKARAYLQVAIQVEAKTPEASKRIAENEIPLRDATITLLSSKTREEVSPQEGRERLKRELLARYEGLLGPNVVNSIYFTSFLTQ